jgi:hypothetical protein
VRFPFWPRKIYCIVGWTLGIRQILLNGTTSYADAN